MKQGQGVCQKAAVQWTSYNSGHYVTRSEQVENHKYNKGWSWKNQYKNSLRASLYSVNLCPTKKKKNVA